MCEVGRRSRGIIINAFRYFTDDPQKIIVDLNPNLIDCSIIIKSYNIVVHFKLSAASLASWH